MIDFFLGHYGYWFALLLMCFGLYGAIMKKNLIKKLIGMSIFQTSIIIFFVASSSKWGATVPILDEKIGVSNTAKYINPLPHTLMLTAIVVGVATMGVALALVITTYLRYKTLDESVLLKRMKKDNDN